MLGPTEQSSLDDINFCAKNFCAIFLEKNAKMAKICGFLNATFLGLEIQFFSWNIKREVYPEEWNISATSVSATCVSSTNLLYGVSGWKDSVDPQKSRFKRTNAI